MSTFRVAIAKLAQIGQFWPALIVAAAVVPITVYVLWGPPQAAASGHPSSWQLVFNLAALILFLSLIPVARHEVDSDYAFESGLVATAALIPTTVTEIATVAAYVAFPLVSKVSREGLPNPAAGNEHDKSLA